MAQLTKPPPVESESICFELDRFEVSADQRLELSGRWFGVRGRRFVRPTLTLSADGQPLRALADLEHKPWAADDGDFWQAAFAWEVNGAEVHDLELAVAPDIAVALPLPGSLPPGAERLIATRGRSKPRRAGGPPRPPNKREAKQRPRKVDSLTTELQPARSEIEALTRELDQARSETEALRSETDVLRTDADRLRIGVADAQAKSAQADAAAVEIDAALARRDSALAKLEAVTTERDSARQAHAQAVAERDSARQAHAQAVAERDSAQQAHAQAVAERDSARQAPARAHADAPTIPARRLARGVTKPSVDGDWRLRTLALAPLLAAAIALAIVLHLL